MITISKLTVENWCQHKYLSISFYRGANGVIGPNGIGKSNFINAILTALTGKPPTDRIEDNIKFDADRAKIVLEFENEGIFGSKIGRAQV